MPEPATRRMPFRDVSRAEGPIYSLGFRTTGSVRQFRGGRAMKDPLAVLRSKEQEIVRIKKEIEALRVAARLLREDDDQIPEDAKPDARRVIPMP
jgi:hypothetical protein